MTYEGLLDDTFGISNGIVELPAGLISGGAGGGSDKKVKVQVRLYCSQILHIRMRSAQSCVTIFGLIF